MRIGIVSDIHGDLHHLDHLRQTNIDQIICAGDLIDFGDDSSGVVRRIADMAIPCIAGNHDKRAAHHPELAADTLEFLRHLPPTLVFEREQTTVMLAHANPWCADNLYVPPTSPPPLFKRIVREAKTDVIILGHTHEPMCIHTMGAMIINPGSVSNNYTLPFGTCGILALPDRTFQVMNIETGGLVDIQSLSFC